MALLVSASILSASCGGTGGWMIMSTSPGNSLDSCLLGIFLPVPTRLIGTTGTPALAATLNAPCQESEKSLPSTLIVTPLG